MESHLNGGLKAEYCNHKVFAYKRLIALDTRTAKTIIDNGRRACVMMQKTQSSANYLEKMTGISSFEINELEPLEFLLQDGKAYLRGKIRW